MPALTSIPVDPARPNHAELIGLITRAKDASERRMGERYDKWRQNEKYLYELKRTVEIEFREKKNKVVEEKVRVPFLAAQYDTFLTFLTELFLERRPLAQLAPTEPRDVSNAKIHEAQLDYQIHRNDTQLFLYDFFGAGGAYGLGVGMVDYERRTSRVFTTHKDEDRNTLLRPFISNVFSFGRSRTRRVARTVTTYEGNVIESVDPFTWYPDTRFSIAHFQKGKYCGRRILRTLEDLEDDTDRDYQNLDAIPNKARMLKAERGDESDRDSLIGLGEMLEELSDELPGEPVILHEFWMRLIPDKYDLVPERRPSGWRGDRPQMVILTMANGSTIIRATPSPFTHALYPFIIWQPLYNSLQAANMAPIEIVGKLQEDLDWFMNSRRFNVRKVLNDVLLVDPSMVDINRLKHPGPGKLITTKPQAHGRDVRGFIQQVPVNDVTAGNVRDMNVLMELMQRIFPATDQLMGQETPERKTATEIRSTILLAMRRLRKMARIAAIQGIESMVEQMIANNQQFLKGERWIRVGGEAIMRELRALQQRATEDSVRFAPPEIEEGLLRVTPETIQGQFDYNVIVGTEPADPQRLAETWLQAMAIAAGNPVIATEVNFLKMYGEFLQAMGITNYEDFKNSPSEQQRMMDLQLSLPQAGAAVGQGARGLEGGFAGPQGQILGGGVG